MNSVWIAQNQSYGELYVFFTEEKLLDFLEKEAEEREQEVFFVSNRYIVAVDEDDCDPIVFAEEYEEFQG